MKRITILFIIVMVLSSCTTFQEPTTLGRVKSSLNCTTYKEGTSWSEVSKVMGPPDIAPIPETGTDLTKNTRIYKDRIIIFYTEMKEVVEEGKVRFKEVVTSMEFCKRK